MAISKTDNYGNIYGNINENIYGMQRKINYLSEGSANQATKQTPHKQQQKNRDSAVLKNDTVNISKAGRDALTNKISALYGKGKDVEIGHLSPISSQSMLDDFERAVSSEKEEGVKVNAFDAHVNQMVSAYCTLKNQIEDKYADPGREPEYYVADDGSIQELTKEKESEMLDRAYEKHSEFMAASTEIWDNLQDFKPQITYQTSRSGKEHASSAVDEKDETVKGRAKSGEINRQAYRAFMSAVDTDNIKKWMQEKDSFPLSLNISASAREKLNHIWDFYANIK